MPLHGLRRRSLGSAKDILLKPISRHEADAVVKRVHYSGKVVQNSQLHIGVFYQGRLEGAMQFGPSLDKRKIQGLVRDTPWNGFLELNRMAFSEALPRNSESRAIGIAMKLLKQHAPHVQWVVSFADGAQCGDGTIYRASGFVLTGIKENNQVWELPDGYKFAQSTVAMLGPKGGEQVRREIKHRISRTTFTKGKHILADGAASMKDLIEAGAQPIPGFQLRYIYFLDPTARERLTVPVLPFSEIERRGAGMYRGQSRATSIVVDAPGVQPGEGGSIPTVALQTTEHQSTE